MESKIDCKGLSCPQPVLKCKECVDAERPDRIEVIVDNAAALENVSRFLTSQGYVTTTDTIGESIIILADRSEADIRQCHPTPAASPAPPVLSEADDREERIVVFLSQDKIGSGDGELGEKLMQNFLLTLPELGSSLWRIILVNSAIYLSTDEHPCLDSLVRLAENGVEILVCGTCLDFFGQLEAKRVGETTNMLDVVMSFSMASKTIQL
ncbi:MAG: sulfurtransferase-like selenium metabolism protein YedF [Proteobacteria bacterium]|nr:sulfurtransferase-like selenium metabolism protein YedF [Pseudomonadota bacterium]